MTAPGKDRCKGKKRFHAWDDARMAVTEAKIARYLHGRSSRREESCYWCPDCHGFHLTSRSEETP